MTQERWQRLTTWPLFVAALVFLVAYSWRVIGELDDSRAGVANLLLAVVWVMFAVDYVVSLALAPSGGRAAWFRKNLFDLAAVILPALRPLSLLRLVTMLDIMPRRGGAALRARIIVYASGATLLLVYMSALAVLSAERSAADASIDSLGDAWWWAFVTVTTVGYGDLAPVTVLGRLIAVGLMIGGIALLGVITATLSSWLIERIAGPDDDASTGDVRRLEQKIDELHRLLEQRAP